MLTMNDLSALIDKTNRSIPKLKAQDRQSEGAALAFVFHNQNARIKAAA
jgi:hypothetical protein